MKKILLAIIISLFSVPVFGQVITFSSITVTSPVTVTTAVGTGTVITGIGKYNSMSISSITQGGVGGTLDIYIQTSPDAGVTWYDYAHYPQLAAGAAAITRTWSVSRGSQQTTLTTIGSGLTPALAVNTIVGGPWGDQLRIVFVSGAGNTNGSSQVFNFFFTQ